MSQNIRATRLSCSGRQGIRLKVEGSGIAIMSDSSIGLKPVIEEPSKPMPPSKASSSSEALIEKLFSWPSRSVNQRRTKRTSLSSQKARTSLAVVGLSATGTGIYRRGPLRGSIRAPPSSVSECKTSRNLVHLRPVSNRLKVK